MEVSPHVGFGRGAAINLRIGVDERQVLALLGREYIFAAGVWLDNLSSHTAAALYRAFPPAEARRILRRLEFHYTPKHASW